MDLEYKGDSGVYSEFNVTHVNNRPVSVPITLGYCQFPYDARLYLSVDLSQERHGTATIEFDLSPQTLHDLHTGKDRIMLLPAIQSAVEERPFANAEDITNQSFWLFAKREIERSIEKPKKQARDLIRGFLHLYTPNVLRQEFGNTVCAGKDEHFRSYGTNHLINPHRLKWRYEDDLAPSEPMVVRPTAGGNNIWLSPDCDYELSSSKWIENGKFTHYCTFTPLTESSDIRTAVYKYEGMHSTAEGMILHLSDNLTIPLSFVERTREQNYDNDQINKDSHSEQQGRGIDPS